MKRRILFVTLILALMLSLIPAVTAQDLCFGLSAEDCAAIDEATMTTLTTANSFNMDFSIDFAVTGTPDGDFNFDLTGSGPLAIDMMAGEGSIPVNMDLTMDVAFDGMGENGSGTVGFMIVDGIAYVNPGDGSWMGVDILQAMEDPSVTGGLPVDPAALAEGDFSGLPVDPTAFMGVAESLPALLEIPGAITYVRNGDVFSFDLDFAAIAASPEFADILAQAGEAAGDDSIAPMAMMIPMFLNSGTINITQTVTDGAVTGLTFATNAVVNTGEEGVPPVTVDLLFTVNVSDINAEFSFAAPEGAEMVPMGQ